MTRRVLRRPRRDPRADALHVMRFGIVALALLVLVVSIA